MYQPIKREKNNKSLLSTNVSIAEKNQTQAWISKTRQKPSKKMRENQTLGFLRNNCELGGEKAEN
jgi:hypothetical protein